MAPLPLPPALDDEAGPAEDADDATLLDARPAGAAVAAFERSLERPLKPPAPAPSSAPSRSPSPATTPEAPSAAPPLRAAGAAPPRGVIATAPPVRPRLWDEDAPPRKREVPRKLRIGIGVGAALLLGTIVLSRRGGSAEDAAPRLSIQGEAVVSGDELQNRKQVSPLDFAPRESYSAPKDDPRAEPQTPAGEPPVLPDLGGVDRRTRRDDDPEDVIRFRRRADAARGEAPATGEDPDRRGDDRAPRSRRSSLWVTGTAPGAESATGAKTKKAVVIAAGATFAAHLETPVDLSDGSTTVVVILDEGAHKGARLIGTAAASRARVKIRLRRLLVGGEELSVQAEVRDPDDGAFGVLVATSSRSGGSSRATSAVKETAKDAVLDVLGGGIAGDLARNYDRAPTESARDEDDVRLDEGTPVTVFFHESVEAE